MAAASTDAVSNVGDELGEPAEDKNTESGMKEQSVVDDAESVHIDEDEYIAIDVYENGYYTCDDKEKHMFALTIRETSEGCSIIMQLTEGNPK
ncbi:hypothetical protein C0993_001219, partial [Termitomyces sp. T159_Od127]